MQYSSIKGPGWQIFLPQLRDPIDIAIETCYNKLDEELDLNKQNNKKINWQDILKRKGGDWSSLRNLRLSGCKINKETLKILVKMEWPCLENLNLSHNKLGCEGIVELMSINWCKLRNINFNNVDCGNEGIKQILCGKIECNEIQTIQIMQNQISQIGITYFVHQSFNQLKKLDLSDNILSSQTLKMLSKCQFCSINKLVLDSRYQNNQGIIHLTKSNWKSLHTLSLYGNRSRISVDSINFLVYSCWPNLSQINTWEVWPITALILMSLLQSEKVKNTAKYKNKELINTIRAYRLDPI